MYRTIVAENTTVLDRKVNKAIDEGWVLRGNTFSDRLHYQTMVKFGPGDDESEDSDVLLQG